MGANKICIMAASEFTLSVEPVFSLEGVPDSLLSEKVKKNLKKIESYFKVGCGILDETMIRIGTIPGDDFAISGSRHESFEKFYERLKRGDLAPAPSPYLLGLLLKYHKGMLQRMADFIFVETFANTTFYFDGEVQKQFCIKRTSHGVVLDISSYVGDGRVNYIGGVSPWVVRGIFFPPPPKEKSMIFEHLDLESKMIG